MPSRPDLRPNGFLLRTHSKEYLDTLFRDFMMTGFGFGTLDGTISQRISRWHPDVIEAARRNIQSYKRYRHLLSGDVYHLVSQSPLYVPDEGDTNQWDILEYAKSDGSEAVVFFFRGGLQGATRKTALKGLRTTVDYVVTSLNSGQSETVSGRRLVERGFDVDLKGNRTSEILLIESISS